ncbi:carbohydrate ABC transporter permease [Paenibacillus arenilitoris]|uniref:Carbohydrate ABC transporter permease n=1 Tax=Paenibacillus arenilitoris TaxID=2772299 RepID=A0A927CNN1_9BACL|nr:carbohydrate ABC transporter permease [Paenibacillus arenilitoris]MBD2869141.1 carbohydrate ABC transporter permease [Paenibacillus arenilitoris]
MKASYGDKVFYAVNYTVLTIIALTCLFPLVHIAALSLSDSSAIMSGLVTIWPKGWSLEAYGALLQGTNILGAFKNSLIITLVGVVLSMLLTTLAAYPLSRKYFYARKSFTLLMVFTMLFGAGMIPTYLVVKSLGLIDTYFALWLPGLISTYNMLVMKSFFENLPEELQEAARIDGCGEIKILARIILPLSLPMLATLSLFYGVQYWNAFMNVLIYINESDKYNLSVLVQQMVQSQSVMQELSDFQPEDIQNITPQSIKSAGVMVMVIPMLLVYPFLQKYFVKGVLIGSIKG